MQDLYRQLRADVPFAGASVGPHAEREQLLVVGQVASPEVLAELERLIAAHQPPWPVDFRVIVRLA